VLISDSDYSPEGNEDGGPYLKGKWHLRRHQLQVEVSHKLRLKKKEAVLCQVLGATPASEKSLAKLEST
jgi:hypothetical protein